jgi:hypothetical protein
MALLRLTLLLIVGLSIPAGGVETTSSEGMLPVEVQAPLMAKILSYDRALPSRSGAAVNIAVLYQGGFPDSRTLGRELLRTFEHRAFASIAGRTATYHPLVYESPQQLRDFLATHGIHVLYLTPLRAVDAEVVIRVAQAEAIATFTPVREHMRAGAAVGLVLQEGRPRMLVNVKAARAQGMDLSAQLLRLAEIVSP